MRTLGFAAIATLVVVYTVTSFLHGSPWYWIQKISLVLLLIVIAAAALIFSPSRQTRAKKDTRGL